MPDISKIKVPGNDNTFNLVDETARSGVSSIDSALANKVDKVSGKGLSANDYTTDEKNKLQNIEAQAQKNVQSDWNATSGDAFIKNKPTIPAAVSVKGDSETSYRTGQVNLTKANIGLGNVTNDKQVKGLSSGATADHVVTWGSDGYTVKDSGMTIGKSVPSNAVFTDTHYASSTVVNNATTSTTNTSTALTNGNVYINHIENGANVSSHKISGSGGTTVTTDVNANIVITSPSTTDSYSATGTTPVSGKAVASAISSKASSTHTHTVTSDVAITGASYTPAGTVSTPTISIKNSSNTAIDLYSMSSAGSYTASQWTAGSYTASSFSAGTTPITLSVSGEVLVISNGTAPTYTKESVTMPSYTKESITMPSRVKATLSSSQPTFTGTAATITPTLTNNQVTTGQPV